MGAAILNQRFCTVPLPEARHGVGCRRLVFHCLLELCRCQAKGIVEHAVLLGTPVGVTPQRWRMARTAVAGRLVNGYSNQDWVRRTSLGLKLCKFVCKWHS